MVGKIFISGEIGVDCTLLDVVKQVKSQSDSTSFYVKIDSVGGYVNTGDDIYNYLVTLDATTPITTYSEKAYSIASKVYMAGSTRIMPEGADKVLMIHLPWMDCQGTHQVITDYLKDLKTKENELVAFYSKAINVDEDTILSLLQNDTYLTAQEALELGFATQLQQSQIAMAKLNNNNEKEIIKESLMTKLERKIDSIMNMLTGKSSIKAELTLQDATGVEIVFPDLESSAKPSVDDKAKVNSKPAEGDYTLPDGTVLKFVEGAVTEIVAPVEEEEKETEVETLDVEVKAEVIKEVMKWEIDVVNTSFEVDEILKYTYEDVEYNVGAGEYELSSGKRVITDADGKIVEVKEATIQEPTTEAKVEEVTSKEDLEVEKLVEIIEISAKKQSELEAKFQALAKSIGSDFKTELKDNKTNVKASKDSNSRAFQILNSQY